MLRFQSYHYFCCACSTLFQAGRHAFFSRKGVETGDAVARRDPDAVYTADDIYLVCAECGAQHITRLYRTEEKSAASPQPENFTGFFVRREPATVAITPEHWGWHAKHEAERAVARLPKLDARAVAAHERFVQAWRDEWATLPRINLLPRRNSDSAKLKRRAKQSMLFFSVVYLPVIAAQFLFVFAMAALRDALPATRRKREEQTAERDEQLRRDERARILAIATEFRDAGDVCLPLPGLFERALCSVACAGCGASGTLTYRIRDGMTCPRCKSDTLEETPKRRKWKNVDVIW